MPSFIVPMAIRYALVSLAIMVALMAITFVLVSNGYMDDKPSSLSHVVVMGAGMWAGTYFAKQAGRAAEWRECFRIGAVLMVLQTALGAILAFALMALPGGGLDDFMAELSPGFAGLLIALLVFTSLIYWVTTAAFIRMGSKSALKAKKA